MKKFNRIMIFVTIGYLLLAVSIGLLFGQLKRERTHSYRVEINRFEYLLESTGADRPEIARMLAEQAESKELLITFLDASERSSKAVEDFYQPKDFYITEFHAYERDQNILGVFRYDIKETDTSRYELWMMEGILTGLFVFALLILSYVKHAVMKPFHELSDLPYQLSKGHFSGELKESKGKYFGRFIWGVSMLKDELENHRRRELKLEKEKKMLLLSLSHDIKTPLNAIKLYARALEEDIYETETEKKTAAIQIGKHCIEIDGFVKEIVKSSSENIVEITVVKGEFYLDRLIHQIRETYEDKCRLHFTTLQIDPYENRLIQGDFDRIFEVFENLFTNAFKYGDGALIRISFSEEDYCQLIHVFNTGEVMKQEEINHVFDSFYRGSNASEKDGNGLGLYICREIMRKCDGEIFAEAKDGGMSFSLVFHE